MIGYAARRLIQTIPTIFVMSIILFGIMQLIPGGPMAALAFNSHQSEAAKLHIIQPATTLAIVGVAADSRFVRASMLDAIHQDFVRTARAKGVPERTVILKHTLRNALLPVITNIALELPILFSGAVVTERIFTWPGMGQLFFLGLESYDYPLMMGILFVSGLLVIFFNVLADFAYAIADPRISYA